jgi:hypothetical protein
MYTKWIGLLLENRFMAVKVLQNFVLKIVKLENTIAKYYLPIHDNIMQF